MIRGYGCRNFRAFGEAGIKIKPITILLGANGIGKTSLLQIPLLLQQTALSSKTEYRSPLKIHGHSVSFGNAQNIILNQDESKTFFLSVDFDDSELTALVRGRLLAEYESYMSELVEFLHYHAMRAADTKEDPALSDLLSELYEDRRHREIRGRSFNAERVMSLIRRIQSSTESLELTQAFHFRSMAFTPFNRYGNRRQRKAVVTADHLEAAHSLLKRIQSAAPSGFRMEFGFVVRPAERDIRQVETRELRLFFDDSLFVGIKPSPTRKTIQVRSDILNRSEIEQLSRSLKDQLDLSAPVFQVIKTDENPDDGFTGDIVLSLLRKALSVLEAELSVDGVNHVAPLRAYPKRYYFLDLASAGTAQGDNLVELLRENVKLRSEVNEWLARFGLKINVEQFREIIHRLAVTRNNLGFDLDITDVGFGFSQVLPVITQSFLAKPGSITVIEQPEIHLHPNMQADLADLFISAAKVKGKNSLSGPRFIIETHSEYLLNRLRRRIAEQAISSDDVALYFVERIPSSEASGSTVRSVEISRMGAFEWPLEFFEETMEDTLQFLELQD